MACHDFTPPPVLSVSPSYGAFDQDRIPDMSSSHDEPRQLPADAAPEVIDVLAAAFANYPTMRFTFDTAPDAAPDPADVHRLAEFFVSVRVLRGEPLLGIRRGADLVAAATVSSTRTGGSPSEVGERREALWAAIGPDARARYEAFGNATIAFRIDEPHLHLNMLGAIPSERGRGHGHRLVEAVWRLALRDPECTGVTLTTEDPRNLPFYEHLGFRRTGHARLGPTLETWGFFRARTP